MDVVDLSDSISCHIIKVDGLDPISVLIKDDEPGRGQLTIVCFGCAWTCWWGAMGRDNDVKGFLGCVDAGYVANCLIRGRNEFISSRKAHDREMKYLTEICNAVIAWAKGAKVAE